MEIRAPRTEEHLTWLQLRALLWPDHPRQMLEREQANILQEPERNAVFVAATTGGTLVGFIEAAIRDWAEGCETEDVGYIEAWYVLPEHQRQGIGRLLVEAAEAWAASRGCSEMASDAELWNELSHKAHRALGYQEVMRLVCFRKELT
jgi:aminoglycoside 6'-N-acetyltransferase I